MHWAIKLGTCAYYLWLPNVFNLKKKGRPIAFSNFSKNINDIIIAPEMIANKYHFVSCMRALVLVLHYLKYLNDKGIQF